MYVEWLNFNSLVANPDKFQMIFLGSKFSESVKLLSVTIDNDLNLNNRHILKLCKSANNKINALIRIKNSLDEDQARKIAQAYIFSQFNYCNLIWMFCSKTVNNMIIRAHKRALRTIYQDNS